MFKFSHAFLASLIYCVTFPRQDLPASVLASFLFGSKVGQILRKATAGTGKKLSLELGGKSPFIVFDSADLDAAVEGVVDAIWFNQGEVRHLSHREDREDVITGALWCDLKMVGWYC